MLVASWRHALCSEWHFIITGILILIMGYHSLEWNWPKEAMSIPIGAGIVNEAKLL